MNAYDQYLQSNTQTSTPSSTGSDPYSAFLSQPASPSDVTKAQSEQNSPNSTKYNGMCQEFADDVLQTPQSQRQPSASDAWNNYSQTGQAVQGTKGIQPGDLIYFNDPNDPDGHVGFYSGNNQFISATEENPDKPVQTHSIQAWENLTGQQILGYVKNPKSLPQIGGTNGN